MRTASDHSSLSLLALASAAALILLARPAHAEDDARAELGPPLSRAVRQRQSFWKSWEVDPGVVAAAQATGTPELRERLVPVLVAADARRAVGYDRLRLAVCSNDGAMSADRARACSTLPAEAEAGWRRSDRTKQWLVRGGATAVYAGAITAAFVERDRGAGQTIATAAGVPIGAITGITAFSLILIPVVGSHCSSGRCDAVGSMIMGLGAGLGGAIAGGVVGGLLAHAASPGARAPVTAAALAPLYLTALVMTID